MKADSDPKRSRNPLFGNEPHPDHFDPTKFDAQGRRLVQGKPRPIGRPSRFTFEQAEQLAYLDRIAHVAEADLLAYLVELGIESPKERAHWLNRLRTGWRPQR